MNNIRHGMVAITLGMATTVAFAEPIQSRASIQEAAEHFIVNEVNSSHGATPEATAGRLDSRLRLTQCEQPLESFLPAGGKTLGNTTVGVRCNGNKPWTLYVPVKVSLYEPVVVAARPLSRGEILKEQDLKVVEKDMAQLRSGYFTDISHLYGKQTTRPVTLGSAITASMVKATQVIERGQRVSLVAESGSLKVRMTGEALEDGAAGELIQVRNLSSKKVVEGTVLSASTVGVSF